MERIPIHNHNGIDSSKIKVYNVIPTYEMTSTQLNKYLARPAIDGEEFNVYNSTNGESCKYIYINGSWAKTLGMIGGKMYAKNAQAIADTTPVVINLTATSVSDGIIADTTNKRFEITTPGFYQIIGQVSYASPIANKSYNAYLYKNTTLLTRGTYHSSNTDSISCIAYDIVYLVSGDYIYLEAGQNSGSSINTRVGSDDTFLLINKL
jgi:hypothetical protein